jgi:putative ABC transport system permease protein
MRTVLAVIGVTLAVLSVTLLTGVGAGVVSTGNQMFDDSGRDLWVSGGPIDVAPGSVGGFQNPIPNAHPLAENISQHDDVQNAVPMAFQVVYVSTNGSEFDTTLGSGVPGVGGSSVSIEAGEGFSGPDTHYAGGSYSGNMSHQVVISPAIAAEYNLSVGDSLYIGGTISNARDNKFVVVGISSTFENFLGTGTVTTRLSELQTLTGNAYDDSATLITIETVPGANPDAVQAELAAEYPEYTFRTNQEQLVSLLERQAVVLAAGGSLVVLGVVSGGILSLNLLLSIVYVQRKPLSVLRAVGATRRGIVAIAVVQALAIASVGYLLGIGLTPVFAGVLDEVAFAVTGFEGLIQVPQYGYLAGAGVAFGFAVLGSIAGAWRVTRVASANRLVR